MSETTTKITMLFNQTQGGLVMQPRLERLSHLIGTPLFESIMWGHEYDLSGLNGVLENKIESGQFKRIVFYGMGCSSVVSDMMKGFFKSQDIPIHVDVVNDYDTEWFIRDSALCDDSTLVIIVCYSGWSCEPIMFYQKVQELTSNKNLIVLSGGGKIADMARSDGTSLILYQLRHADREYPLYHVQQFFSIFLDLFYKFKLTNSTYEKELRDSVSFLKETFDESMVGRARGIAKKLHDCNIAFLATPRWYVPLLKQTTMFFNEIAMVPAHRNLLHEFSHTEVAAFSSPKNKLAMVVFNDIDEDAYTRAKIDIFKRVLGDKSQPKNKQIELVVIDLDQKNFFQKFFFAHFFMMYVAYYLGQYVDAEGRDLISITAGNPWWSQKAIDAHPDCVNIPGKLDTGVVTEIAAVMAAAE
jgi:glucose/mannose-6-phosphate isomerase